MTVDDAIRAAIRDEVSAVVPGIVAAIRRELGRVMPPQMVPLREAAQRMGVDPRTVQAAGERGDVKIKRVGRRILVDANSLRPVTDDDVARMAAEARGQ